MVNVVHTSRPHSALLKSSSNVLILLALIYKGIKTATCKHLRNDRQIKSNYVHLHTAPWLEFFQLPLVFESDYTLCIHLQELKQYNTYLYPQKND